MPWSISVGILNKHMENVWNFLSVSYVVCLGSVLRTILGQDISNSLWFSEFYSEASSQAGFLEYADFRGVWMGSFYDFRKRNVTFGGAAGRAD